MWRDWLHVCRGIRIILSGTESAPRRPNPEGNSLGWTDRKDLGRSTGSYGSRKEDGGVRMLGLGLNPKVVPTVAESGHQTQSNHR